MAKTHYEMLGVSKTATDDQIKTAYRQLAKKYHPDLFSNAPEIQKQKAQAVFTQMTNAYVILSNPEKKAKYDESLGLRPAARPDPQAQARPQSSATASATATRKTSTASASASTAQKPKAEPAAKPVDGSDIRTSVTLTFDEACLGTTKPLKVKCLRECKSCNGTGFIPGGQPTLCPQCKGKKIVPKTTLFSQSTIICPTCNGIGTIKVSTCPKCGGNKLVETIAVIKAKIPAGVVSGTKITFAGQGNYGKNGGKNGDLILEVNVEKHRFFTIEGHNLLIEVPVSFIGACIGTKVPVPVLNGMDILDVPENTKNGDVLRIKGQGIPGKVLGGRGDLLATVIVEHPKNITATQKQLLNDMNTLFSIDQYTKTAEYMKTLKEYQVSLNR